MRSGNSKRTLLIRRGLIGCCEFIEYCELTKYFVCLNMRLREHCEVDC